MIFSTFLNNYIIQVYYTGNILKKATVAKQWLYILNNFIVYFESDRVSEQSYLEQPFSLQ